MTKGNPKITELLLGVLSAVPTVHVRDGIGRTPLHHAAERGDPETVRLLLQAGSEIHAMDQYGSTPLHLASSSGKVEVVEVLLDHRASTIVPTGSGNTAVLVAAYNGHHEVIRVLLGAIRPEDLEAATTNCNSKETALHVAVRNGHLKAVQVLLENGMPPNYRTMEDWNSPLHIAVKKRNAEERNIKIIELLIAHGADPALKNKHGDTPLHFGVRSPKEEVIEALLRAGGNPHTPNFLGQTPRGLATFRNREEFVLQIFEKWPKVVTLRSLCIRTVYRKRVPWVGVVPPLLLWWPNEREDHQICEEINETYRKAQERKREREENEKRARERRLKRTFRGNQTIANNQITWVDGPPSGE